PLQHVVAGVLVGLEAIAGVTPLHPRARAVVVGPGRPAHAGDDVTHAPLAVDTVGDAVVTRVTAVAHDDFGLVHDFAPDAPAGLHRTTETGRVVTRLDDLDGDDKTVLLAHDLTFWMLVDSGTTMVTMCSWPNRRSQISSSVAFAST